MIPRPFVTFVTYVLLSPGVSKEMKIYRSKHQPIKQSMIIKDIKEGRRSVISIPNDFSFKMIDQEERWIGRVYLSISMIIYVHSLLPQRHTTDWAIVGFDIRTKVPKLTKAIHDLPETRALTGTTDKRT
jgi:hypothetical protein